MDDFQTIKDATIAGELVEFSKQSLVNAAYGSTFTKCDIVLVPKGMPSFRGGSRFQFVRSELEHCIIRANGRVHDFDVAETVLFKHCKFVGGPFTEPRFGSGILSNSKNLELIEMCDFSESDLRDARFYMTSIKQVILPTWPHIAVVARDGDRLYTPPSGEHPAFTQLDDAVRAFDWGDDGMKKAISIQTLGVGEGSNKINIQVSHAEDVVRRGAGSLEQLKEALDRFGHPAFRY